MEWSILDEGSQTGVYTDMEQWIDVRRAVLAEGVSKRAACRRFGIHWDTLERILRNSAPPGYVRKRASEKSVIAPWLGRLGELIEANRDLPRKQRYTVKRMWDVLLGEGFALCIEDPQFPAEQAHLRGLLIPLNQQTQDG